MLEAPSHLNASLAEQGFQAFEGPRSIFVKHRSAEDGGPVLQVIYVDDFVMVGHSLSDIWAKLGDKVKFGGPPSTLSKCLGVNHSFEKVDSKTTCAFGMGDFAKACVTCYREKAGIPEGVQLRKADTPMVSSGVPCTGKKGKLKAAAPSLLMKLSLIHI